MVVGSGGARSLLGSALTLVADAMLVVDVGLEGDETGVLLVIVSLEKLIAVDVAGLGMADLDGVMEAVLDSLSVFDPLPHRAAKRPPCCA